MPMIGDERTPERLARLLADELRPTEKVLWTGRPSRAHGVGQSLVGTLVGVIWVVLNLMAFRDRATLPWFVPILTVAGLLIGIWLLFSPVRTVWHNARTMYVITSQRALLIEAPWRTVQVQTFTGQVLENVIRRAAPSGRGDLVFEREASAGRRGRTLYRDVGFFGIPDVHRVEQLLPRVDTPR
jgi:hypothetical protein